MTTSFVVFNGLIVALIVIGLLVALIDLLNHMLW